MYVIVISLILLTICDVSSNVWLQTNVRQNNGPIYYLMFIPVLLTLISGLEFLYNNRKMLRDMVAI